MSMTFTKLFSSITESTIWTEPNHVRIVWITMLAMADSRGRVWASIPGLANRARVSVEQCEEALVRFKSPDKYSRTPDNQGIRIADIDGGWKLLNHEKYRSVRDEEAIKESKRNYINTRRAIEKRQHVENVELRRYNAEADTEAYTEVPPTSGSLGKGVLGERAIVGECREIPDEKQALAAAEMAGVPNDFAGMVFRSWSMRQGRDGAGVLVDWLPYVRGRWAGEEGVQWQAGAHREQRKTAGASTVSLVRDEKALTERIRYEAERCEPNKAIIAKLKAERKQIRERMEKV